MNKNSLIFFVSCIAASVVYAGVRYYQCLRAIDFSTGFYYGNAELLGNALYIIMGAAFLGYLICSVALKKQNGYYYRKRMGQIDGAECIMLGILTLLGGGAYFYEFAGLVNVGKSLTKIPKLQILLNLFAIIGFILIGIELIRSKRLTVRAGMLMLMPSGAYVLKGVDIFTHNLVVTSLSDKLVAMLLYLSLGVFYLSLGRIFIRGEAPGTKLRVNYLGFFAATLVIGETLGKQIYWLTLSENIRSEIAENQLHLAMPDFAFVMDGALVLAVLYLLHKTPFRAK